MYVDRCVFFDGVEVYQGKNCPHTPGSSDELGIVHEPGWTVQQTTHNPKETP